MINNNRYANMEIIKLYNAFYGNKSLDARYYATGKELIHRPLTELHLIAKRILCYSNVLNANMVNDMYLSQRPQLPKTLGVIITCLQNISKEKIECVVVNSSKVYKGVPISSITKKERLLSLSNMYGLPIQENASVAAFIQIAKLSNENPAFNNEMAKLLTDYMDKNNPAMKSMLLNYYKKIPLIALNMMRSEYKRVYQQALGVALYQECLNVVSEL